jgi:hypothetical protein
MSNALKASCLVVYLLAVVGAFGVLRPGIASAVLWLAVILLVLHVVEVLVAFKFVKRHPGPLVDSVGLTLLFGFLHWMPLSRR